MDKIIELADVVYDMCQRAYQPIGGFHSLTSAKDISKRVKLLKIVMSVDNDGNDAIGACGLYRVTNGGYKGIGYAGNKDAVSDYRECVQLIVKDDIAKYNDWYWVEASGAIQHYFEKHNGYLIPNIYVSSLLSRDIPTENLLPDGFSYKTIIGSLDNPTEVIKRLFGFPNKDAYDSLMKIYGTLDNFSSEIRKMLNDNAEPKMESVYSLPKQIDIPIMYICNLDECVMENQLTAIPRDWMDLLDKSVEILKQEAILNNNVSIANAIEIGTDLQQSLTVISLSQFHINEEIDHITI
ncbi:MAG: hypothetical protein HUK20_12835 [Fibrobacter sp.]|nr:hypothetical protein [Fibrobacter sp.]